MLHNLCFFWIKNLFAQAEDPYSNIMVAYFSELSRGVLAQANGTPNIQDRFYLDALVVVLEKASVNIPHFVPSMTINQKDNILQPLILNYDLIHIDHEREVSMMLILNKNAALTVEAVTSFYKAASLSQGGHKRSPLTGLKQSEKVTEMVAADPGAPNQRPRVTIPAHAGGILASLNREHIPYAALHSMQSAHAVIFYNKVLYHYNSTNPALPTLTPIVIPATPEQKNAYTALQEKISHLPKDRIFRAEQERAWMETLLTVPKDKAWRPMNLDLLMQFLKAFVPYLEKKVQDWQRRKTAALWLAIMTVLSLVILAAIWYGLGLFPIANIIVLVQFALYPVFATALLGLGFSAYSYIQEQAYRNRVKEFTHIDFRKTYPSSPLLPEQTLSVTKSLSAFFTDHQTILATAIPLPAPRI